MMNNLLPWIEQTLDAALPRDAGIPQPLLAAMRYSLLAGGKRIRPWLLVSTAWALGGGNDPLDSALGFGSALPLPPVLGFGAQTASQRALALGADTILQRALTFGTAVEMIHTYSLIHDDLPCMDNDDLRRGKPTCHVVYGEAMALLAGDGLLSHAAQLLMEHSVDSPTHAAACTILKAAGVFGMVAGQCLDLTAGIKAKQGAGAAVGHPAEQGLSAAPATEDQSDTAAFYTLHRQKTGALIAAAVVAGGHLARADAAQLGALAAYGEHLGLAFQIVDDCLDVTGDTDSLGKQANVDAALGKDTFVARFGLSRAQAMAREQTQLAVESLAIFEGKLTHLSDLAERLANRKN